MRVTSSIAVSAALGSVSCQSSAALSFGTSAQKLSRKSPPQPARRRTTSAYTYMSASPAVPSSNRLLSVPRLQNAYYALRHGQSLANVAGIISSDPAISTVQHGLSDFGHEQARDAGDAFAREFLLASAAAAGGQEGLSAAHPPYRGVAIYSSDFTRARETAQHLADALTRSSVPIYEGGVVLETRLRERNFGELNGGPDSRYPDVWAVDSTDAGHNKFGVESVNSVVERTTGLILEIEDKLGGVTADGDGSADVEEGVKPWKCVLVVHGDVLQILQTGFGRIDGSLHRTLPHLETATVRELSLVD